jgi:alkaline phosphatase
MIPHHLARSTRAAALLAATTLSLAPSSSAQAGTAEADVSLGAPSAKARNVIFFVGDGMGVSTVTATRIFSVGVAGQLQLDQFPFTALSRTYSEDSITADSAPTMTAMITGQNTNSSVLSLDATTEPLDFNHDGDGAKLPTLIELAKAAGKKVGVLSTARITHATPAACYAHINNRDNENAIALQPLPTDATYNTALGSGLDLFAGGGRQFFVPNTLIDEEGVKGSRTDGRDLRVEYQAAGYTYVWETAGWSGLTAADLPVIGLFEASHMEWEYDRPLDAGGEPSLTELTTSAIDLLSGNEEGYVLVVEGGRIDHAHHAGNAYRALVDTEELDEAIEAAIAKVDLSETLIVVTADHSHVFNIAGYPLRPQAELPYTVNAAPADWVSAPHSGLLNVVYDVSTSTGNVTASGDKNGVPYTVLVYGNGPGYRGVPRVDPLVDAFPGLGGVVPAGPGDPAYLQEAAVPLGSETHAGEEVALYAIGKGSSMLRGTVKNTFSFKLMKRALGL